jgi:hypothetical protein
MWRKRKNGYVLQSIKLAKAIQVVTQLAIG